MGQLLTELSEGLPYLQKSPKETEAFTNLVGWDGSLRTQIQQAKAAVIYPPAGLHPLFLGKVELVKTGGTGLGLAIVKHSAEYHDARVQLISDPGQGTRVKVFLKRHDML